MKRGRMTEQQLEALHRPAVKRAVRHRSAQGQRAAQQPRPPSETAECRTFIAWTKLVTFDGEPLFDRVVKIANERGKAGVMTAILESIGMKRGFPDYVIHCPVLVDPELAGQYVQAFGLYLEAKRIRGSKVDDDQVKWRTRLLTWGYHAEICEGGLEMISAVKRYMRTTGATATGRFLDSTRISA